MPEPLLTQSDVAMRLGVSRTKVSTLTAAGELPCIVMGRNVRYDPAEIEAWIDQHRRGATAGKVYQMIDGVAVEVTQ